MASATAGIACAREVPDVAGMTRLVLTINPLRSSRAGGHLDGRRAPLAAKVPASVGPAAFLVEVYTAFVRLHRRRFSR